MLSNEVLLILISSYYIHIDYDGFMSANIGIIWITLNKQHY